jgi:hypothetical protein
MKYPLPSEKSLGGKIVSEIFPNFWEKFWEKFRGKNSEKFINFRTDASEANGVSPGEGHGGGLRAGGKEASLTSTDSGVHSSVGAVGVGTASDVAVVLV